MPGVELSSVHIASIFKTELRPAIPPQRVFCHGFALFLPVEFATAKDY